MTGTDIAAQLADPDGYLFAFDGDAAVFRRMDRLAYHRSIFLDDRIVALSGEMRVPLGPLLAAAEAIVPQQTGWIFHLSHCGSTLLARALDRPGSNLVLREPRALRQLAVDGVKDVHLRLVALMAGRRYQRDTPTIIKANVPVNFILPALARLDSDAPAIFLYLAFEPYVLAMLRTPQHRDRLMRLSETLASSIGDVAGLGPAERAAALWLAQIRAFTDAMAQLPNSYSLDAEVLFGDPREAVGAAANLFGLDLTATDLDAIIQGSLFATHAKDAARPFDNVRRVERATKSAIELAPDLALARAWIAGKAVPLRLARPLAGDAAPLL